MPKSKHRKAHKTKAVANKKNVAQEKMHQEHRMRMMYELMLNEQMRLASEQTSEETIEPVLSESLNDEPGVDTFIGYTDVILPESQIEQ